MPNARFNLVQDNGDSQLTLYHEGETHAVDSTHPAWEDIYRLVIVDDDPARAAELCDPARLLRRLVASERVTVTYNEVLFDNDPVHDALADHIIRLVNEGEDVSAWVKLLENIKQNPNPESVEQFFRHISRYKYTITPQGMVIAYKGVSSHSYVDDHEEGTYYSTRSGFAIRNGEELNGFVPNAVGDVIEMPRSKVTFDPNVTCSHGLHVADWNYAKGMGSVVLAVLVNPRDVVSVPTDHGDAKVRVCRYKVLEVRTEPYSGAVLKTDVTISVQPEAKPEVEASDFDQFQPGDRVYWVDPDHAHASYWLDSDGSPVWVGTIVKRDDDSDGEEAYVVEFDDHGELPYDVRSLKALSPEGDNTDDDESSDSETTKENNVSATATATPARYRYPSPAKFDELVATAKRQKKGVKRFIQSRTTWSLIEGRGDGADRKDWAV